MDEDLKQAMESVKEQQSVELNLEWYQAPITLEEIKQFIRANINAASRSLQAKDITGMILTTKRVSLSE